MPEARPFKRPFATLLAEAGNHRPQVINASIYTVLNKFFDVLPELLIGVAIDVVVRGKKSLVADLFDITDRWHQLLVLAAITVAIWVCESITDYLASLSWRTLAQDVQHDLRTDLFRHLQTLDLAWFEDRSSGGLLSVVNDDVNQLERFLDIGARDVILTFTNVLFVGLVFAFSSPLLCLIAFTPIPIIVIGSLWWQRRLQPKYAAVRSSVGHLSAALVNSLSGMSTIAAFTAEEREAERIEGLSEDYRQKNLEAIRLSSAFVPLIRMGILAGFVATLVAGGWLAIEGHLNVGLYTALVYSTQRLLWPFTRLGETFDLYQRAAAGVERILLLLHAKPAVVPGDSLLPQPARGEIRFENVRFAYSAPSAIFTDHLDPNAAPPEPSWIGDGQEAEPEPQLGADVLRGLDLVVPAGETHAIVGTTGAGKSTVLKIILRQYEPTGGRVTFDGVPLDQLTFRSLRQAVGYVAQDTFLFEGSIKDNVALGRPDASDEELRAAIELAEAAGFVDTLADGWDTIVGERGQRLSGGQRQRLALARAIVRNPTVLMLDEATSAVDNETEAAIQRSLEVVSKDRTTIVVAHRLSTVRHADKIHVLEAGKVVESGTHEELLELAGLYAALWRVQTGERS